MFKVTDITFDLTGVPAAVQSLIAAIDAVLSPPWTPNETQRTFTLSWGPLGGPTPANHRAWERIMGFYRQVGLWNVYVTEHRDAASIVVFSRIPSS